MAQGITGYFDIGDSTYNPSRFKLRVHYSESYDVSANQSTVSITKLQLMSTTQYSWVGVTYYPNGSVSVGDKTVVTCNSVQGTHSAYIGSRDVWTDISGALGSVTISHNSDGSGSAKIAVSIKLYTQSGGAGNGADISGSQTVTLTTIARASSPTVSAQSVSIGGSVTISTNRASSSFTHTLRYALGTASGTIATGVEASYAWTIPASVYNGIKGQSSGTMTVYCDTFSESNFIGTKSISITVNVPNSMLLSSISATPLNANIGLDSITFLISSQNDNFLHKILCEFGGYTFTIKENVEKTFIWSLPYSLASKIPSKKGEYAVIYCKTYRGEEYLGQTQISTYLSVPNNSTTNPTMNPVFSPTGSLPSAFSGMYVQGKTALKFVFNASSSYSAVESCSLTIGWKTYTGDTVVTNLLTVSGDVAYTASVTDKRGYSMVVNGSIHVEEYAPPSLGDAFVKRTDSAGTETPGGDYLRLKFTKSFSPVDGKNTCTVKFRVKPEEGGWGSWVTVAGSSYDSVLSGYFPDPDKAYTAELSVSDDVGGSATYTYKLASLFHTMHLKAGGRGIAFGKKATKDLFECGMPAQFISDFFINGCYMQLHALNTFSGGPEGNSGWGYVIQFGQWENYCLCFDHLLNFWVGFKSVQDTVIRWKKISN